VNARRHARGLVTLTAIASLLVGVLALVPAGASSPGARARQADDEGTIRIAAEEEPFCADWVATCGGLAWGNWALGNLTMPQALNVDTDGNYVPGDMLVDFPTLEAGPPMTVTYRIKEEAVWSDGTPITSEDFEYTWDQIVNGRNIYDSTGYVDIESIDTTDPKVAVVTFSQPFAAWQDLFGGFYFVLPKHLLEGKNRGKEMRNGYEFSGAAWQLEGGKAGWKKGESITLVPNDAFWGTQPTIERVIFQFIPESEAELEAVTTGQVVAAYPLPIEGAVDTVEAADNLDYQLNFGNQFEAFWLNADRFPLDSQAVRQAIAYATDREAIVEAILVPAINEGEVLESFVVPTFAKFHEPAFDIYTQDLAMVDELMTGDGWEKNGDGFWEKDGQTATFVLNTTTGNAQRELTEQLWQSQLVEAGFDMSFKNLSADVLFGKRLPSGRYQVGLYASVGTPDPGLCLIFCSESIPARANKFSGQNWTWTDDPAIDESLRAVDVTIDEAARIEAARTGQTAIAEYVASIPLFQSPTMFIFDITRLGGRLEDNTVMGPFFTMNEWVLL
jgi:peptide/nickel transport system substrate-binding protein